MAHGMSGRRHTNEARKRMKISQQARRARERQLRPLTPTEELETVILSVRNISDERVTALVLAARRMERKARRRDKAL